MWDFGPYNALPRNCQVRGDAIVELCRLIKQFVNVCPHVRVKVSTNTCALTLLFATSGRNLNPTRYRTDSELIRAMVSSWAVVLAHVRRLRNKKKFAEALSACSTHANTTTHGYQTSGT